MNLFYTNQIEILNQNISELKEKINVSFEFFPPNTDNINNIFWKSIEKLQLLKPKFFSITCGTNYKKNNITFQTIKKIKKKTDIEIVPHLTCINKTNNELKLIAENYWSSGIRHIIALRGDIPFGMKISKIYAINLIKLLKETRNFKISVAAYPEVHPEAITPQSDLINLKKKIDAGADNAITQFFFDVEKYLRFRDKCLTIGIENEIIPGILPILNFTQIKKFTNMTNVKIPNWMTKRLNGLENDLDTFKIIGASITIDIIKILVNEGIKNFHFYTLNQYNIPYAICHLLGVKPIEKPN